MFGYMTDLETVEIDPSLEVEVEVEGEVHRYTAPYQWHDCTTGHDHISLLYNLMNEFLYVFGSENYLVCKEIEITEFDEVNNRIKAKG